MKSIFLLSLFLLLTSCIYTEGTPIIEPQDVTVSPNIYQWTPWEQCGLIDVTIAD